MSVGVHEHSIMLLSGQTVQEKGHAGDPLRLRARRWHVGVCQANFIRDNKMKDEVQLLPNRASSPHAL